MANETTDKSEKEVLKIQVKEHSKFDHITDAKFLPSKELCESISELFRNVYADYEGCVMEVMPGTQLPMISLFFNHKEISGTSLAYACSKSIDDETKNTTLRSLRLNERMLKQGDRYYLTDEGKSGLEDFLIRNGSLLNNGKINWGKIVADVADPNVGYLGYGTTPMQYTKVSFIDPAAVAKAIYGEKDEDGTKWVYGIRILRSLPTVAMLPGQQVSNSWMLALERVCEQEVNKLAMMAGFSVNSGLDIIR